MRVMAITKRRNVTAITKKMTSVKNFIAGANDDVGDVQRR
jgi:hypothetical protein